MTMNGARSRGELGDSDPSALGHRPRICVLGTYITRAHSGTTQSTISIANALARRNRADVWVFAMEIEPGLLDPSVRTCQVPMPPAHRLVWRVGRLLIARDHLESFKPALDAEGRFDLAYTQYMECAIAFRHIAPETPLVTHFGHVLASQEAREVCVMPQPWRALDIRLAEWLERRAYRLDRTSHAASTRLVAETRCSELGLPAGFFHVQPLGVDASRFSDHSQRARTRAALGIADDDVALVSVARMVGWKQLDWLIAAMDGLPDHCHLIVVGDGEERARLTGQAAASPARARIHFTGLADPVPYLAAADIFGLVSRIESFGLVYAEAMLMGLPCIGLRYRPPIVLSTAQDVIMDSEDGFVVDDVTGLRARWMQLAIDGDMRTRFGTRARERAQRNFTSDAYAAFLEQFMPRA